ncbi:hypothetical protein O988_01617 [Pseudogymnoascus sp. VKM F-3808]|nr:hypothetical protein O988_01617 [Pseudogymnoascus sp. VKM F-3808]
MYVGDQPSILYVLAPANHILECSLETLAYSCIIDCMATAQSAGQHPPNAIPRKLIDKCNGSRTKTIRYDDAVEGLAGQHLQA